MNLYIGSAILLFLAVASIRPCWANDMEQARANFSRGVELFAAERYEEALETFEESYGVFPRTSTLLNIGMCHKALSRHPEAITTFRRFLEDEGEDIRPEMRIEARAAIKEMMLLVGELWLTGVPDDARVSINGEEASSARPQRSLVLNPGHQ